MTFEVSLIESIEKSLLLADLQPVGMYSHLGSHWVGLFVIEQTLFLAVDGHVHEIGDHKVQANHSRNKSNRLEIAVNGSAIHLDYQNDRAPLNTIFYSEDEEDADFGLWLRNILVSNERRKICVEHWGTK